MGGINYVYWMGARLTPWMLYCLQRLDADLRAKFGVHLVLDPSKGIRTEAEQTAIFLSRYRAQRTGSGPFGDVRWWNGTRYVRHSGLGTVAAPRTSNHEIQGTTAAVDVADSGGAGIGTWGSERSNWLRANAGNYGLIPEGFNFKEAWHYAVPNIFQAVPGGSGAVAGGSSPEEDDMPSEQWLTQLGADIVAQVNAQVNGVKADVATVHNTVISGQQGIIDAAHAIRADINYIHTLSPYSLKAVLEASRGGEITLTDAQVKAIGGQLSASAVAGIDAALRDDFEGVKAQLAQLPKATIAALKAAL